MPCRRGRYGVSLCRDANEILEAWPSSVRLSTLRLFNFRNFTRAEVSFSPGSNMLFGRNAQGKTNVLEAIYILAYGKSFRTVVARDCIQHGEKLCGVEGVVEKQSVERDLGVAISSREKKLMLHRKSVGWAEFVGNLHVAAFTSEHLGVIRGGPGERRAFLDRAMVTVCPGHIARLAAYTRALRQRNKLLSFYQRQDRRVDDSLIEAWEEKLIVEGTQILRDRARYVEALKGRLPDKLFGDDTLTLQYISNAALEPDDGEEIEWEFRERLSEKRTADLRSGFTSVGPHRDDLKLFLNGKPLAEFGSAGEQRSSLLSLYFAQMEAHKEVHGFYPVFMVDDVEAELDSERMKRFLGHLAQRTQVFLTTARETSVAEIAAGVRRYEVRSGTIAPAPAEGDADLD